MAFIYDSTPPGYTSGFIYDDDSGPPAASARNRLLALLLWSRYAGQVSAGAAAPAPAPAPPPLPSLSMPSMRLSSVAADTAAPYTFGMQFADGQIPANVVLAGETNSQAIVKRRYQSGAASHVIFSGRKALPGGYLVNAPSGLVIGATSIPFDTGSGTIVAGDYVWFGADKRGTQYLVSSVSSGTLTIATGLLAAVADNSTLIVERPVTFSATSATPSGTALTAADIATAAPTASIALSSIGTVSLASLLASPFETFLSGPQMVEAIYRAEFGAGTLLAGWFSVRLYAGGRINVRAWVENGYLDNGAGAVAANATRSYTATVTIGGSVAFTGALTHEALQVWHAEGWIGGAADVIPRHDTAYIQAARLTPDYSLATGVSDNTAAGVNAVVNGGINVPTLNSIVQVYTPLGKANQSPTQADPGYQNGIGFLPLWDALYLSTKGDPRAWRAMMANNLSVDSFGIRLRDFTTKGFALPRNFPRWAGGTGYNGGGGAFGGGWESAHFTNDGYLGYMLTGDYRLLNVLTAQAMACYYIRDINYGLGTSRLLTGAQVREWAWMQRTAGCFAAIAPTGWEPAVDSRGQLAQTMLAFRNVAEDDPKKAPGASLGFIYLQGYPNALTASETGISSFMNDWRVAVTGWLSDLDLGIDKADLLVVRDYGYKSIVYRHGPTNDASQFGFVDAASYRLLFGGDYTPSVPGRDYTSTPGGSYQASYGVPNTLGGNSYLNPGAAATSYLGQTFGALAYAVEHGYPGAAEGHARRLAATNWAGPYPSILHPNEPWEDVPINAQMPRVAASPAPAPQPSGTAPVITSQPANQTVVEGTTATFSVVADGTLPLAYQWRKRGVALNGENGASVAIGPVTSADNGDAVSVVVQNAYGTAISANAILTTRTPSGGLPTWRQGMVVGEIREIPGSSMYGVNPAFSPGGVEGPSARIRDWCGLAYNSATGDIAAVAQGGHDGWAGNDVLKSNVYANTAPWSFLRQPSAVDVITFNQAFYNDGRPASTHGGYGDYYIPQANRIFRFGFGPIYRNGYGHDATAAFNLGTNDWDGAGSYPNTAWPAMGAGAYDGKAQDQSTHDVYFASHTTQRLVRFNAASQTFTQLATLDRDAQGASLGGAQADSWYYRPAAYDHTRGRLVVFGYGGASGSRLWTNNGGQGTWQAIYPTMPAGYDFGPATQGQASYNEALDRYIFQTQFPTIVLLMHPTTWVVTVMAITGGSTLPNFVNGTMGRFGPMKVLGGYVGYTDYTSNMHFLCTEVM